MAIKPKRFSEMKPQNEKTFRLSKIFSSKYVWIPAVLFILVILLIRYDSIITFWASQNTGDFLSKNWIYIFGALSIVLTILFVWLIPKWQVKSLNDKKGGEDQSEFDLEKEKIKLRDDARKTIAQIIGGVFFVLGLFVTYNTFELNRQGQEINAKRQVSDRFAKAVELLGNTDVSVRLGGLYALEQISHDNPEDYHSIILETLAAFIREKSKQQKEEALKNTQITSPAKNVQNPPIDVNNLPPPTDVLAAYAIIRRRDSRKDEDFFIFNFGGANLNGAKFYGEKLMGADFNHANLNRADFNSTILHRTNFNNANLNYANLKYAKLGGANMEYAELGGANLKEAEFYFASLLGANLRYAVLDGADLGMCAGLNFGQISKAIIDAETKLPPELEQHRAELIEISKKNRVNKWLEELKHNIKEVNSFSEIPQ